MKYPTNSKQWTCPSTKTFELQKPFKKRTLAENSNVENHSSIFSIFFHHTFERSSVITQSGPRSNFYYFPVVSAEEEIENLFGGTEQTKKSARESP